MKYNNLINEFLNLLDEEPNIVKLKKLKNKLLVNDIFLNDLNNYHLNKTILNKKKLFTNKDYEEYLKLESYVNLMIFEIKSKFNDFSSKRTCL